jgi:hypothetical protein
VLRFASREAVAQRAGRSDTGLMTDPVYETVWHARVPGDDPDLVWVAIGRWTTTNGAVTWCLELWDAQGEAGPDLPVESEDAARELAEQRFGMTPDAWMAGPQPFAE